MSETTKLSVREIKRILNVPQGTISAKVTITPDMARQLLRNNINNRVLRHTQVRLLVNEIKDNHWHTSPDSISFGDDGILTNGQHRLHAIASAGKSVEVFVTFGVNASTAIDTGTRRTFSDNARICGDCDERIADKKVLHQVFASAWEYRNGKMGGGSLVSKIQPDDLVALMNKYADELLACLDAGIFTNISTKGCASVAIKSALFLAYMNGVDMDVLQRVMEVLRTGIAKYPSDAPIIGLRDILMKKTGTGRAISFERFCLTQCCVYKVNRKLRSKTLEATPYYTYQF